MGGRSVLDINQKHQKNSYEEEWFLRNRDEFRRGLPVKESFDVIERQIVIGGRQGILYFIDGFIKDEVMQRILTDFFQITAHEMKAIPTSGDFVRCKIPYVEVAEESLASKGVQAVLSGQTAMLIEGYEKIILMDLRTYPTRSVEEPEKEKTLRGSRDGLVETIVFNTALIRRRVRDSRLVFDMHTVGKVSKTDVCIGYLKGVANEALVKKLADQLDSLQIGSLTVGDQSLVESFGKTHWANPFPKVRYTERPDVAAAHLAEGKFVILVDNSPTAIILPTGLFDFLQDVDDYYFPVITGNYFRLVRNLTMLATLFLTPVYLLIAGAGLGFHGPLFFGGSGGVSDPSAASALSGAMSFLLPQEPYQIPLFWQFLLLELAIDGLKLASLNTPSSLGMSLSVIGALILGEFSVTAGWFVPQTILCMAVVALAGFSQPSIELSYAVKFMRLLLLIAAALLGWVGFWCALALELLILGFTKTITGTSYLYPLIPFHGKELLELLVRTKKKPAGE